MLKVKRGLFDNMPEAFHIISCFHLELRKINCYFAFNFMQNTTPEKLESKEKSFLSNMKKTLILLLAIFLPLVAPAKKKAEVRYGTFNIRYINPEDDKAGYGWSVRRDRVAKLIREKDFDIFGTQEVLKPALDDLLERLPEYDYIGVGRTDGVHEGEHECIFYKKDKYELLDSGNFWLSETPDVAGSKGWDAAIERVASWGKFRDKKTKKIFMSINTHFDHIGVEARKQSALLIIEKIKEIVGKKPAIVTGDFNITDKDEAYKTITTNKFVMNDAYKVCENREGCDYTFQSFSRLDPSKCGKIDFIFITPNIKTKKVYIETNNPAYIISDHNPHWADLEF